MSRSPLATVGVAAARQGLAIAIGALAVWLTHAVIPVVGGAYFFFVFPAALLVGLTAGSGPALACVATYATAAAWLFIPPARALAIQDGQSLARLLFIAGTAAVVGVVGGRLRTALRRERRLREQSEREVAARAAAESALRQAHDRLSAVQALTAALSAARTSGEVAAAVFAYALPLVGARAGSICSQIGPDQLAVRSSEGFAEDARSDSAMLRLDAPLPTTEAARSGRGVWLRSAAEIDARYPHLAEARARGGDRAWACVPLRVEGEPAGVLGLSFRDERGFDAFDRAFITSIAQLCGNAFSRARRHEAEQEARARAEAAEEAARLAAALQDQVLAVVGHDLRTPLSAITMAIGIARQRSAGDERLAAALERIERSARRMHEIIRDLLDAARARQGLGLTVARGAASAQDVCAQAVAELEHVHPQRVIRFSASGDLRLEADASRLSQAVSNLVANALQHGAPGAEVSVEAVGHADEVVIRVRNGGAPIPDALLKQIFEPFRRGDGAGGGAGVGLGLFIVREIARAHGGSVSVSSAPDAGTTFELRLPRGLATAAPARP